LGLWDHAGRTGLHGVILWPIADIFNVWPIRPTGCVRIARLAQGLKGD